MRKKVKRFSGILASTVAIIGFALPVCAGTLDPPASAVDAVGNPVPTTPTPPSWSQKLPAAERFVLVLDGAAVLDRETGLVWEKAPDATSRTWLAAVNYCTQKIVGNRGGWRLPTVDELASLVDYSTTALPRLSPGHPFTGVTGDYWSANEYDATTAWRVPFYYGSLNSPQLKTSIYDAWCVR